MRYWLLASLAVGLIVVGIGVLQPTFVSGQVKDKKNPLKDGKDKKDKVDPKEIPTSPDFKEPDVILGKNFEYWLKKIHSDDPSEREIAMKNILFFGPKKAYEAVPDIIQELKYHGPTKNPNIDLSVRVNGIQALHTIFRYKEKPNPKHFLDKGQSEKEAILLAEKEAKRMEGYINETFEICKKNLKKDQQVILRMQTMKGMANLGPKARDAFSDILKLTEDVISWEMRKEAIPVLVILAAPDGTDKTNSLTSSALKALSNSSNPKEENSALVRQTALQGIATLGTGLPFEFERGLRDPSLPVRLTALQCIATMSQTKRMDDQSKKSAVKRIDEYLEIEPDKALNMWAHAAIMTIQRKVTPEQIKPILKRMNDKDTQLRLLALQIVGMMGPEAKKHALETVEIAIHEPDIEVGVAAIRCCVSMHAIEVKSSLKRIYDNPKANDALHFAAAEALDAFEGFEKMQQEKEKNDKKDKKSDDKK
jgi:hypothetical protein